MSPTNSTNKISPSASATFSSRAHGSLSTPAVTEMVAIITDSAISAAFRRQRIRDIKRHAQPVVELHHANPERSSDTEDGADHRRNIDAVPIGPLIFLPKWGTAQSEW